MRAWIFSDLHLDANDEPPFALPNDRPDHDVVLIAGDVCQGLQRGVEWIAEKRLNEKPVVYVPGNHEYYGFDFDEQLDVGKREAAKYLNIHVLDRESVTIGGVHFLGTTLWTDYALFGEETREAAMQRAELTMNDHRLIRFEGRRWTAMDAMGEHRQSATWLRDEIAAHIGAPIVVVTHTAPSIKSIAARYKDDLVTAAFATNLERRTCGVQLWVHGHTHVGSDYRLGDCRVVNNPRGYLAYGEGSAFDQNLVCDTAQPGLIDPTR
jgi:Icc-related predicted phosphoesterase